MRPHIIALALSFVTILCAAEPPVLRLTFDEGSGTQVSDANGTFTGITANTKWVGGVAGSALSFNAADKPSVTIKDSPLLTPASISVSLWFKPSGPQKDGQLLVKMSGSGKQGYRFNINGEILQWQVPNESKAWGFGAYASEPIKSGSWNYAVGTYDGATVRVYLNGKSSGTMQRGGPILASGTELVIGAFTPAGGNAFSGDIDEVRIYARELTGEEIMKTYENGMKKISAASIVPAATGKIAGVKKLLVIGDSITKHGPAEKLGWLTDWGMAASAEEKDYVHLVHAAIAAAQGASPELSISAVGGGTIAGKLSAIDSITAVGADLVIIQLGENDREATEEKFERPYESLVSAIKKAKSSVRIYCTGTWRSGAAKDEMIRTVCRRQGVVFVDITKVHADPEASAGAEKRFTNGGVNWHPGDKGMQGYADAIIKAMTESPNMPAPQADARTAANAENTVSTVLLEENFDGDTSKWIGAHTIVPSANGKALSIVSDDPSATKSAVLSLPVEKLRGKKIRVEAQVKAVGVSEKPKSYNGIKCMLVVTDAESRKDYPQAAVGIGTFEQKVSFSYTVHEMAVKVELLLGLEVVSGTVMFDNVRIVTE